MNTSEGQEGLEGRKGKSMEPNYGGKNVSRKEKDRKRMDELQRKDKLN